MTLSIERANPDFWPRRKSLQEKRGRIELLLDEPGVANRKIARMLKKCRRNRRCKSPSCPICARRFQNDFFKAIRKCMRGRLWGHSSITLMLCRYWKPKGQLNEISLVTIRNTLRTQFLRLFSKENIKVVGCVEVNFNKETQMWEVHTHIIAIGSNKKVTEKLKKYYEGRTESGAGIRYVKEIEPKLLDVARLSSYIVKFTTYNRKKGEENRLDDRQIPVRPPIDVHNEHVRFLAENKFENFIFKVGLGGRGMPTLSE